MSHLEVKGSALTKNARNVLVWHRVKVQNYIFKFSQDISLSGNETLNSYLNIRKNINQLDTIFMYEVTKI